MTVDVEDVASFDEILTEIKAHDDAIKENYAAQKKLWEKLVNTFGAEEAANIVCAVTGITPAGRKHVEDALDRRLRWYILTKQVDGVAKPRFKDVARLIHASMPITELQFRTVKDKDGKDQIVCDFELEPKVVFRQVSDDMLKKRFQAVMKKLKKRGR